MCWKSGGGWEKADDLSFVWQGDRGVEGPRGPRGQPGIGIRGEKVGSKHIS